MMLEASTVGPCKVSRSQVVFLDHVSNVKVYREHVGKKSILRWPLFFDHRRHRPRASGDEGLLYHVALRCQHHRENYPT